MSELLATGKLKSPVRLIADAWRLYRDRWLHFAGIMAVPVLAGLLVAHVPLPELELTTAFSKMFTQSVYRFAVALILFSVYVVSGAALLYAVTEPKLISVTEAYRRGCLFFLPFFWVSVLTTVAIWLGFILLIIPGVIALVYFSFATLVLILENKRGLDALIVSQEHVQGYWWAVFIRLFLVLVPFVIVTLWLSTLAFGQNKFGEDLLDDILVLFTGPFMVTYTYMIYLNVRKLKGVDAKKGHLQQS